MAEFLQAWEDKRQHLSRTTGTEVPELNVVDVLEKINMWALVDYSTISNEAIMAFPASMSATGASATYLSGPPVQNTFDHQQDQELNLSNNHLDLWFDSRVDLFGGDAGNATAVGM